MKTKKTIFVYFFIVFGILISITIFEFFLLRLLDFQYQSLGSLVIFFIIYLFFEFPLSLIIDSLPKALKAIGIIKSSKGLLSIVLDVGKTYILIITINYFMKTITISWQGTLIFSLISGFISWKLKQNDKEPPMINNEEFKLLKKTNSKK
ncbi:YrvL family regulatory protein [Bacillus cereus]|nr:YrvL family regulatory protein [Bacillus cereus]MDA2571898.1 YrvL family regulatory protein [Bacillus cereus]